MTIDPLLNTKKNAVACEPPQTQLQSVSIVKCLGDVGTSWGRGQRLWPALVNYLPVNVLFYLGPLWFIDAPGLVTT